MPSWQSTSRIGCPIDNPARRSRGAAPSTRPQWTRVPLDFRPRWRYVVNKAGAANAAPALKYKFYFTPHFCGYTEFGIVPLWISANLCYAEKRGLAAIRKGNSPSHEASRSAGSEQKEDKLQFLSGRNHASCPQSSKTGFPRKSSQ